MITNFQIFNENYFYSSFNVKNDDYVFIQKFNPYIGKFEDKLGKVIYVSFDRSAPFPYKILTSDGIEDTYNYSNIKRFLTKDEIEIFNIQIKSNKYNI